MKRIVSADDNGKTVKLTDCSNYNQLIFHHKYKKEYQIILLRLFIQIYFLFLLKQKKIRLRAYRLTD